MARRENWRFDLAPHKSEYCPYTQSIPSPQPARGGVSHAQGRKSGLHISEFGVRRRGNYDGAATNISRTPLLLFLVSKARKKPWAELYSTIEAMYGPRANSPPPFGRCLHLGKGEREVQWAPGRWGRNLPPFNLPKTI